VVSLVSCGIRRACCLHLLSVCANSNNYMPGDGDQPVAADLRAAFEEAFIKYKARCSWCMPAFRLEQVCVVW